MYYCFLKEDVEQLTHDPLVIQKEYAKRLGSLCVGSLEQRTIYDASGAKVSIVDKEVLLRCTYDNLIAGIRLLSNQGATLTETEQDVERIESWYKIGITNRRMQEIEYLELLAAPSYLGKTDKIFLKSKRKGFSAIISTARIVHHDPRTIAFLEEQNRKYGSCMVLSKYVPLKTDSLGTRETRHIVLNNQVANSSRLLHSIKHTVPKSHKLEAIQIAEHIKSVGGFPANYALDLGEFVDSDGNSYVDIVELNPISCSMCYVNNSIYVDMVPEIREYQQRLMMGIEFCYDAIANPTNYYMMRVSGKSYTYTSDSRHLFL